MLDQGKALVSWMESDANEGEIRLAIIDKEEGKVSSVKVTQVSGSRATGFPQLEVSGDYIFMAWNERIGELKRVKLIRVDLDHIYP